MHIYMYMHLYMVYDRCVYIYICIHMCIYVYVYTLYIVTLQKRGSGWLRMDFGTDP